MQKIHYTHPTVVNPEGNLLTFLVIGCGGTGTRVAMNLAKMNLALRGLGHPGLNMIIADNDRVSEFNIARQLFFDADIGEYKADVMAKRINRSFGMSTISYTDKITSRTRKINGVNIIISCVDNVSARRDIEGYAVKFSNSTKHKNSNALIQPYETCHYWIDTGNTRNTGQVIIGTPGTVDQPKSKKYETIEKLNTVTEEFPNMEEFDNEIDQGPSCSLAEALEQQDLFINPVIADYACSMVWKMIQNMRILYRGIYVNLETFQTNPILL